MMFAPRKVSHRISGSNNSGASPRESRRQHSSSLTSRLSGSEQCLHSESMRTLSFSPLRCPCTKDVAKASSAHAPDVLSPEENVSLCGVEQVVTGKAQLTFALESRTRKKRCLSKSERITATFRKSRPVTSEICCGEIGLGCRGISRTTKSRTTW